MRVWTLCVVLLSLISQGLLATDYERVTQFVVTPAETLKQDLFFFGRTLKVQGTTLSDVFATSQDVEVTGEIGDDLLAFSRTVQVDGRIKGGILFFGEELRLRGTVQGDIRFFGRRLILESGSVVKGSIFSMSAEVHMEQATVEGNLEASGGHMYLNGHVKQDVRIRCIDIAFGKAFQGDGQVLVTLKEKPQKAIANAPPQMKLNFVKPRPFYKRPIRLWLWFSKFFIGMIFLLLFPQVSLELVSFTRQKPLLAGGIGALFLFVTPILALIALLLLPLAFIVGGIYVLILYLSRIFAAIIAGYLLFYLWKKDTTPNRFLAYAIGFLLLTVLLVIPFLGFLVKLAVVLFGTGAFLLVVWNRYRGSQNGIVVQSATGN